MDIAIFDNGHTQASTLREALVAEGHGVQILAADTAQMTCDLIVLDAAAWSAAAINRLARRLPNAELLLLVNDLDTKLPSEAAMALLKPVDPTKLLRLVRLLDEARSGRGDPRDLVDFETLFSGDSPAIVDLLRQVRLVAQSEAPVAIYGELGSGRVVAARAIHDRSLRQGRAFIPVNAAAFPGDQLDHYLFGGSHPLIQRADGGTLFIDCATELAANVQPKLLRVVDERLLAVAGVDHRIDVRVMIGDERASMTKGSLRPQLYYRLKVHEVELPPLRERANDLGAIVGRILERLGRPALLSDAAARSLGAYAFPGNVRELAHALMHAVVLAQGSRIEVEHLPVDIQEQLPSTPAQTDVDELDPASLESLEAVARRFERTYLLRVLRAVGGNRTRAAKILDLSRKGLWQKLKAHGIPAHEGRDAAEAVAVGAEDESDLG
ncbi:MAG: sigma-54-dependent Fis family transcriptional regulator [Deltaproteobacteria bacterium]|nr:sigma-54-dependent Fis family transcriptional regulator [Deltaproteobacteria bacterium]MDQ3296915.1 sigma 54-interacting transcriptional regulator [Myxococcota bacterium]